MCVCVCVCVCLFACVRVCEFPCSKWKAVSHKKVPVRPPASHLKDHQSKTNKTFGVIVGKIRTNSRVTFYCGLLHMDAPMLAVQQRFTYISSAWTLDAV